MGLADRVLPEHIQRAGALESQLREYMKNQKMLEQQSNRAMNNREVTTALELRELSNKQKEEVAAVEKELIELYRQKQKKDKYIRNEEQKNVLEVADRLELLGGNPKVVEKIRKNA
ncbi:hypothetical protein P5808_26150 [Bacillus cereus]|uniref:hypothetical protein n=1 Tax=Bacillus cereus group TaxID=86661 RepID=UPI0024055349|nr:MULTISPECIES: hypothetical protein [Bacillus cereus group]MDF9503697.1 hypothetical protein [Bacillus cereus]MDF9597443.1 hypothetical protein [Bacillus cereus]MDF9609524.1 hypothetical protein [Bacillus cereus]MDF9660483.1 hypothetical protein [Bacillus cereus]MDO6632888.1 hypothetical protein [Bacillus thuringiensis]